MPHMHTQNLTLSHSDNDRNKRNRVKTPEDFTEDFTQKVTGRNSQLCFPQTSYGVKCAILY